MSLQHFPQRFPFSMTPQPTTEGPFVCNICSKGFALKRNLTLHKIVHMSAEAKQELKLHPCHICTKRFHTSSALATHIATHGDNSFGVKKQSPGFLCDICNKSLGSSDNLKNHKNAFHLIEPERPFSCTHCPKSFVSRDRLNAHFLVHAQGSAKSVGLGHICYFCQKSYSSDKALETHSWIHTGEKPFFCDACDSEFISKYRLNYHKTAVHDKAKPFGCAECGKYFRTAKYLKRHGALHATNRPSFPCNQCPKSYRSAEGLREHVKAAHFGERYQCNQCGECFARKDAFFRHFRTTHK